MFRWVKRNKKTERNAAAQEGGAEVVDWDFLRAQPDHDADVMADVHGDEPRVETPAPALEAPVAALSETIEAAPAAKAFTAPPPPPAAPVAEAPIERRPLPKREPIRQHPTPRRGGEHDTKPLTLLSELCAKFQDPSEAFPNRDRIEALGPGWTVTLRVAVSGRTRQHTVSGETIIGRFDPETGKKPDVDLGQDDTISRRHARIYVRNGRYWLQDLESMNGTRHNGEWLQPGGEAMLVQGDVIELGELCRIQLVDPVMNADDRELSDLLNAALGGTICAEREAQILGWDADSSPTAGDLLELALRRGGAVGLIRDADR